MLEKNTPQQRTLLLEPDLEPGGVESGVESSGSGSAAGRPPARTRMIDR